jgi:SAM-dependent methyltransferase
MAQPDLFPSTAMPDHDWWQALWPDPMAVVRAVGVSPGMTVVDVGCGDGHFTAPLAQLAGDEVYALDLDPAMLELARREVVRTRAPSPHWICGDAMELAALVPVQVDLALMANTFHGVPDKNRLAHAIARVVKPGGRWVIINWHRRPREETTVLGSPPGGRACRGRAGGVRPGQARRAAAVSLRRDVQEDWRRLVSRRSGIVRQH